MKRLLPHYLLTGCLSGVMTITGLSTIATAQTSNDLSYRFYGQSIPLTLREDVIAVDLKQKGRTRGEDPYVKLQRSLQGGTRGGTKLNVDIQPLSQGYAVLSVPAGSRSTLRDVEQRVQKLPYVNGTIPVLSRQGQKETILLPNEIVVSFDRQNLDQSVMQAQLKRYGVEVVRPVAFSKNQVVVRAVDVDGIQVLRVAQQLNRVQGIRSATPNFIQSVQYQVPGDAFAPPAVEEPSTPQIKLQPERIRFPGRS